MKRFLLLFLAALLILPTLCACEDKENDPLDDIRPDSRPTEEPLPDLGDDDATFGEALTDLGAYDGYFEETLSEVTVACISGTPDCYTLEGNTLTFTSVTSDSVYAITGKLKGNIVIDIGDDCKFDLELTGFSLVSDTACPITVLSGDEVSLTAKVGHENYIYDLREAVDPDDETTDAGAIYATVDLEICGKGSLTVISENNNGIHSKDDIQVKNLTLLVSCVDNALKGNDSVTLESGTTTLIATEGDGIKTSNTDISDKGNQRGTVTVSGGTHTVYAACDGIDAAYNVLVEGEDTVLTVYTDKYSGYSSKVTAVDGDNYYIRFTSDAYLYSVKYYNSDSDFLWVTATYHSSVSGGRNTYYYYSFPKNDRYAKMQFFLYSAETATEQEEEYLVASDYLTPSQSYDTFALTSYGNRLTYTWTSYTTSIRDERPGGMGGHGGPGGMGEGNTEKGDHSTKGIKAGNEIAVLSGNITVKSYDDALHAKAEATLENGDAPLGSVRIDGGNLTLYSNDDGIHADGSLTVTGGTLNITHSYEGLEGSTVVIDGGDISVIASDDGVNATTQSGTAVTISGGWLYIYCTGDGIDANSRTSYRGILFCGGHTVVITTSGMNSAIDTEQGYAYEGGTVLALMPSGGMTGEATDCRNFSSVSTTAQISLREGTYLVVHNGETPLVTLRMPVDLNGRAILLGHTDAEITTTTSTDLPLDRNGVFRAS